MTRHFFSHFSLALAGLLASPVLSHADTTNLALAKSEILEGNVAYLRVSHVAAGLPGETGAAIRALTENREGGIVLNPHLVKGDNVVVEAVTNSSDGRTLPLVVQDKSGKYVPIGTVKEPLMDPNPVAGTVLDLRFADGDDAAAATATANLFAAKKLPLAVLVNGQTRGAAMTLATALRDARAGLIFGSAPAAVKPDISVGENPADERKFFENPYAVSATSEVAALPGTNDFLSLVDHTSEADLVRAKIKDGDEFENPPPPRAAAPQKPVIRDPVLARATDLIKGLAVVREFHP